MTSLATIFEFIDIEDAHYHWVTDHSPSNIQKATLIVRKYKRLAEVVMASLFSFDLVCANPIEYPWIEHVGRMMDIIRELDNAPPLAIPVMRLCCDMIIGAPKMKLRPGKSWRQMVTANRFNADYIEIVGDIFQFVLERYPAETIDYDAMYVDLKAYLAPMRIRYLKPQHRHERSPDEISKEKIDARRTAKNRKKRQRQRQRRAEERSNVDRIEISRLRVADAAAELQRCEDAIAAARAELDAAQRELIEKRGSEAGHGSRDTDTVTRCVICQDAAYAYLFVDCGHPFCCDACYGDHGLAAKPPGQCAFCRRERTKPLLRVYAM